MKKLLILVLLISFTGFAQDRPNDETWLQPNSQPNAKHIVAFLDVEKDSLKIRSEFTIGMVYINNMDLPFNYERPIYAKEVDIPLKDIPNGLHMLSIKSNGTELLLWLNVYVEPTTPERKIVYIAVPYNITTTQMRKDRIDSDTIYIKESRNDYIERMEKIKGFKNE